jgi:hypothetical protein
MHVQIDLCMHMPCTSQTSALQNLLRSAVVFKASLVSVCSGQVVVCYIADHELIGELSR